MKLNWNRRTLAGLVVFTVAAGIHVAQLRAQNPTPQKAGSTAAGQSRTRTKGTTRHKATAYARQQRSRHHRASRLSSSGRKRSPALRRQQAPLHPEPDRIQEIQQALAQAGYLNEQPNGRWDDQTRDAMRRYQTANGLPVTGLPEAKSLMKLGLGPHPLPADADSRSGAKAGADMDSAVPATSLTPTSPDAPQTPP